MTTLPSVAVRNALAAIELTGDFFAHTSTNTRLDCWPYREMIPLDQWTSDAGHIRFYELNEMGKRLLDKSPLWRCAQYLIEQGYSIVPTRYHKPGFVRFQRWNEETERYDTAFVSAGKAVYEQLPGKIGATCTFTA